MIDDLIAQNKKMLEYAKSAGGQCPYFIDVLRANIAMLELQKSGVTVSRECAEHSMADIEYIYRTDPAFKPFKVETNRNWQELRAALSAKESE